MISSGTTNSFEFGLWRLIFKNITMHIVGIYRPPSLTSITQFVADFFSKDGADNYRVLEPDDIR